MRHSNDFESARARLEARRGFLVHVAVFVVVIAALFVINITTSPAYLWAKWPLIGWGIGVAFHGLGVFVFADRFAITDAMVEHEMREHELSKQPHT